MGQVTVYRDAAVVLRVTKLGEADRIVTLLTRREGRVRAVAKGVRRTKSKFGGRLEPFSHVDLQLYAGRNLDIVTQAETLDPFGPALAADYPRYTCATAIAETAERLTAEEHEPSLRLYLLVVSALRALSETGREPSLVLDAFLLRAMVLAGWAPALNDCARCGTPGPHTAFHIPSGGLLCADCRGAGAVGAARPAPATIELMAALADGVWPVAESAEPAARREASGLVAALLQWHLERGLRSLPMVDRLGEFAPVDRSSRASAGADDDDGDVPAGVAEMSTVGDLAMPPVPVVIDTYPRTDAPDRTATDQTAPDRTTPDRTTTGRTTIDRPTADRTAPDRAAS